jgi:hypothetical protein
MSIIDLVSEIDHIKVTDQSFFIIKVGSDDRPASDCDIDDVKKLLQEFFEEIRDINPEFPEIPCLITHHNVDFKLYSCAKG